MRKIDNIANELKRGYNLTINRICNPTTKEGKCYGLLALTPHPFLISDCEEVEVDSFLSRFPHIIEELNKYNRILKIHYNMETGSVTASVEQEVLEGVYGENKYYEVVEDFQEESLNQVLAIHNLNARIEAFKKKDKRKLLTLGE